MNRCLFFFFVFIISNLSAQIKYSNLLKGRVTSTDSISTGSIHVINKTRGSATITDEKGYFEIFSSTNDTLLFSAVQFRVKIIIVNNQILESEEIVVPLEKFINRLSEVIVRPHNLSGDLYEDLENSAVTPINFYSFGIPGFTGTRKEKIVTEKQLIVNLLLLPVTGSLPIEPIYKHLSGYYKDLKKKRKLDTEFDVVANLIRFYGIDFFVENYKLNEDEVYEFVSGTYENFPLRESFKRNEHNIVIEYFEKNHLRTLKN